MGKLANWTTLVIGGCLSSISAGHAADLGGNCCADLEDRISEIEATVVQKGNRKVSLSVSGWVNEAVFFWDDGVEENAYVGTNGLEQSRFRFLGEAQIVNAWTAGYLMEINVFGANSATFSQSDSGSSNLVGANKVAWFLTGKGLGRFLVGLESTATEHLLDDADFTMTRQVSDADAARVGVAQFLVRGAILQDLTWASALSPFTPGQSGVRNVIRYDTPTVAGVTLSATWGGDDEWAAKVNLAENVGPYRMLIQAGYGQTSDNSTGQCSTLAGTDCSWWGAAGTVMHNPTGLYVYGGYGHNSDRAEEQADSTSVSTDSVWFLQGGIEREWASLGKTNIFMELRHDTVGSNLASVITIGGDTGYLQQMEADFYAAGIIQSIDAAAMSLYAVYRHADGNVTNSVGASTNIDNFDMLITGAKIDF
jgi:hypothetical protein